MHRRSGMPALQSLFLLILATVSGGAAPAAPPALPADDRSPARHGPALQQDAPVTCCVDKNCWTSADGKCDFPRSSDTASRDDKPARGQAPAVLAAVPSQAVDFELIAQSALALKADDNVPFVGIVEITAAHGGWGAWLNYPLIVRTECEFRVLSPLKGSPAPSSFLVLGGEVAGEVFQASNQPPCRVGDRLLLLLTQIKGDQYLASQATSFHPINSGVPWLDARTARLVNLMAK